MVAHAASIFAFMLLLLRKILAIRMLLMSALSPSKHARAHGECMDKQGKKKALWQSRKEIKRRRLELKEI